MNVFTTNNNNNNFKGVIILLVLFIGHSGCGKNSIINELLNIDNIYKYVISTTSREIRFYDGESEGNPYNFLSSDSFLNKIELNGFLEYEEIHGNYYGLDLKSVEKCLNDNNHIYLKDIGVVGASKLKSLYGNKIHSIFIDVENLNLLKERLYLRGSHESEIITRLNRIDFERSFISEFDIVFTNIDLFKTSISIDNYLKKINTFS